jgi:hypothetical protein
MRRGLVRAAHGGRANEALLALLLRVYKRWSVKLGKSATQNMTKM